LALKTEGALIDCVQCKTEMLVNNWKSVEALKVVSSQELFLFMQHASGSYNEIWRGNGQEAESFSVISHSV
jgi:hypothetical protein